MTKKDYIAIAAVLNANVADLDLVLDFADMLGRDNPRFDRQVFVRASTVSLLDVSHHHAARVITERTRPNV